MYAALGVLMRCLYWSISEVIFLLASKLCTLIAMYMYINLTERGLNLDDIVRKIKRQTIHIYPQ